MDQLESLELAFQQKKERLRLQRVKQTSIEDLLHKKTTRLEKKIKEQISGLEFQSPGGKITSSSAASDKLRIELEKKRLIHEELQNRVHQLQGFLASEEEKLEAVKNDLTSLEKTDQELANKKEDSTVLAREKALRKQINKLDQDIVENESLLQDIENKKSELEGSVSDNIEFLVNFSASTLE